jgi:hypothetical protein
MLYLCEYNSESTERRVKQQQQQPFSHLPSRQIKPIHKPAIDKSATNVQQFQSFHFQLCFSIAHNHQTRAFNSSKAACLPVAIASFHAGLALVSKQSQIRVGHFPEQPDEVFSKVGCRLPAKAQGIVLQVHEGSWHVGESIYIYTRSKNK